MDLLWEKGDSKNQYTYNGEVYDKPGTGTPDFLQPGFTSVKIGDEKQLLQVSDQFSPIFLLDQSGGVVADILSDVAKLDSVNTAIRMVEKDRKEASATRKVREKDVTRLKTELDLYEGLDESVDVFEQLRLSRGGIVTAQAAVEAVEGYYERLRFLARLVKGLQKALGPKTPEITTLLFEDTRLQKLIAYELNYVEKAELVEGLQKALGPKIPEITTLLSEDTRLQKLIAYELSFAEKTDVIQTLSGIDQVVVPSFQEVDEAFVKLGRVGDWCDRLTAATGRLRGLKDVMAAQPPDAKALAQTFEQFETINVYAERYTTLTSDVEVLTGAVSEVEREEQEILDEFESLGMCPTCSQSIHTHEHL